MNEPKINQGLSSMYVLQAVQSSVLRPRAPSHTNVRVLQSTKKPRRYPSHLYYQGIQSHRLATTTQRHRCHCGVLESEALTGQSEQHNRPTHLRVLAGDDNNGNVKLTTITSHYPIRSPWAPAPVRQHKWMNRSIIRRWAPRS